MAHREEASKSECKTSFLAKATDKACRGAQFFWEIAGGNREYPNRSVDVNNVD